MTEKTKPAMMVSGAEEPPLELNIPEVVAEVRAAFLRYQHAVDTQDVETMNELFWTSPFTVRFGPNGTLIGHDAIANYRQMITLFTEELTWLGQDDKAWIMGRGLCEWLNWPVNAYAKASPNM